MKRCAKPQEPRNRGLHVELFPCSGGMAEGFRRAGITFDLAFDKSKDACAAYEQNLGHRPVCIDVHDLLEMARHGWTPGRVRLLVADPPCTPWSTAGKQLGLADERDVLAETCELISILRPDAWLIANVPGLDQGPALAAMRATIGGLSYLDAARRERGETGWCIDYKNLNAAGFGVPQHRHRPFWFGHRPGTPCLMWPEPTHADPHVFSNAMLIHEHRKPWQTVRDALGHLPLEKLGKIRQARRRACNSDQHGSIPDAPARVVGTSNLSDGNTLVAIEKLPVAREKHPPNDPDSPARTVKTNGGRKSGGASELRVGRAFANPHPPSRLDEPARTVTSRDIAGHGGGALVLTLNTRHPVAELEKPAPTVATKYRGAQGACALRVPKTSFPPSTPDEPAPTLTTNTHSDGAYAEWPWDRPATTITGDERLSAPGHHDASISGRSGQHGEQTIVLSELAAAILQGFPETWAFVGSSKEKRFSQIGQAMPPGLAEPVARAIAAQMAEGDPGR